MIYLRIRAIPLEIDGFTLCTIRYVMLVSSRNASSSSIALDPVYILSSLRPHNVLTYVLRQSSHTQVPDPGSFREHASPREKPYHA